MKSEHADLEARHPAEDLFSVRGRKPLVHCITNQVSMNFVANALLAVGALPVMASAVEEVEQITAEAQALLLNTGTISPEAAEAMRLAAGVCADAGIPIVIDPVGAGASNYRRSILFELMEHAPPAVIRANASEIIALSGRHTGGGVDSVHKPEDALFAAKNLAAVWKCPVVISGAVDYVVCEHQSISIANGSRLMSIVTGIGCAAGALIAAFAAVCPDRARAAASSMAVIGVAGELAAEKAEGPGSFQVSLLDALYMLDAGALDGSVRLQTLSGG
ncbi:MAG TPA: hydroxyethylthiazole kinase [Desulfobacteraceae bacterium]|jgi:hydroxyethylthiazole kinase|nr:hydroxyethylthiazole kinase [Desulfobacteraceae bacterium]